MNQKKKIDITSLKYKEMLNQHMLPWLPWPYPFWGWKSGMEPWKNTDFSQGNAVRIKNCLIVQTNTLLCMRIQYPQAL